MHDTVFVELKFWILVVCSFLLPGFILWLFLTVRAIKRSTVLVLAVLLVAISGVDFYLLQELARLARLTPSLADDAVFDSEVTIGLYLLPALLAGVGINVASHVLIQHLTDAESRFARGR